MDQSSLDKLDREALTDAERREGESDGRDVAAMPWFLRLENVEYSEKQFVPVFLLLHHLTKKFCS